MKAQLDQLAAMGSSGGEAPDMSGFFKQLADLQQQVNTKASNEQLHQVNIECKDFAKQGDAKL